MNLTAPILTALVAILGFSSVAHAQANPTVPRVRQGFYLRATGGPGFAGFSGDGPTRSASLYGMGDAQSLSIGGSLAPGLVLAGTLQSTSTRTTFRGGPFRAATLTVDGASSSASHEAFASFTQLGVLLDWYPVPTAGWHAGLSGGLGAVGVISSADNSTLVGISPAGTLFGGYDWRIGGDWSLGLELVASGAGAASLKRSSGDDTGYRLTPVSVSVQASILYF